MNKKRINQKSSGKYTKKIYNTPQLSIHGELSVITKSGPEFPVDPDYYGCSHT